MTALSPRASDARAATCAAATGSTMSCTLTRSINTSTVPPHVSPISHASSSSSEIDSTRRPPFSRSASAASTTCASTQPPIVTPPIRRPLSPTIIFVPTFFDVLPVADTNVASATDGSLERSGSD
jgi:hypothetical protein